MYLVQKHTQPFKEGCYVQNSSGILIAIYNFIKSFKPDFKILQFFTELCFLLIF